MELGVDLHLSHSDEHISSKAFVNAFDPDHPNLNIQQATELIVGARGTLIRIGMRPRVLGRAGDPATVTLMRAEPRSMAAFNEGGAGLVLAEGLDGISTVIEKVVRAVVHYITRLYWVLQLCMCTHRASIAKRSGMSENDKGCPLGTTPRTVVAQTIVGTIRGRAPLISSML